MVDQRKPPKQALALRSQVYEHLAAVILVMLAAYQGSRGQPVQQLDGAVMKNLKALCKFADGRTLTVGKAFDGEHKLMLLRLQAMGPGGLRAELQEFPNAVAEFRQSAIFG